MVAVKPHPVISPERLYVVLAGLFVASLLVADLIGSRIFVLGPLQWQTPWGAWFSLPPMHLSSGIIPFPITFVLTDLINEFYGKRGARFITWLGFGMALFAYGVLFVAMHLTTSTNSPISQQAFVQVFSNNVIVASLTAYLIGQFLDIHVFGWLRGLTQTRLLWLRATGSTVVSQCIDSLVVTSLAFYGKLPWDEIAAIGVNNYSVKFVVALGLTPVLYLGHAVIEKLMGFDPPTEQATVDVFHPEGAAPKEATASVTVPLAEAP